MKNIFILLIILACTSIAWSQKQEIHRFLIVDSKTQEPLPYANILFINQGKGTISNEAGYFSIDPADFNEIDSISIQYIGYKNLSYSLNKLLSLSTIKLEEELINLSEAWVYGNPPKAKDIIKKVIENKDKNYQAFTAKSQVFVRNRENTRFDKMDTYVKKNTITEIEEDMIERIVSRIPREFTSFTDFLTYSYTHKNSFDSVKLLPQKTVTLEEIEIAEIDQFGKIFESLFRETEEDEYWKVKSGIFGEKLDIEDEYTKDTLVEKTNTNENKMHIWSMKEDIISSNKYATLNDEKTWEFLYKTGRYKYELMGGSKVNGEDVYIIDFIPRGGKFIGRVYVSTNSYALLKADFQYAEGKDGRDFQLLGIGYHENKYRTSISYDNVNGNYQLKYLSNAETISFSIERRFSLLKKKERFLFDKKLKEIKVKLDIAVQVEGIKELLVLNSKSISENSFLEVKDTNYTDAIYVDHFSDDIWKGYPIIEPTKQMREYQKQEIDWAELGKK